MPSHALDEGVRQIITQYPGCSEDIARHCLEKFMPPDPPSDDDDAQSQLDHDDNNQVGSDTANEVESQYEIIDKDYPWMPKLPILQVPDGFNTTGPRDSTVVDVGEILAAVQEGRFDTDSLRKYLGYYSGEILNVQLNADVDGYPAMFYIVSTNNSGIIREWIKHGGDPNTTWGPDAFPVIAFSVLNGGRTMAEASRTLATLLRFGADPRAIPKFFYDPYSRDLPNDGPTEEELDNNDAPKKWCTTDAGAHLARSLSLSQRYDLYRASKIQPHSGREKELLTRQGAEEVLGLHQMIVAQSIATRWLQKKLLAYLARQKNKPLVLVFAGPSGHGKTELAQRFRDLMSLESHTVDCTNVKQDVELFGPRPPFSGNENGSALNNFLVRKAGERCIVFMDEFEKTSKDIQNTLLLPFQDGKYEDRRTGKSIDCSKSIWILATNQLDGVIQAFCKTNEQVLFYSEDEDAQDKLVEKLCRQLRKEFVGHFGAPLGGRITEILPFLVFAAPESAVIVHKALMDLETELARRVHLALNKDQDVYVGNISMRIKNDASVCSTIANEEYDKQTGARSIFLAVERLVADPLVGQYLKDGDMFDEGQETTHFVIDRNVDGEVEVRLAVQ
ncbi:P-loop containing nucleoside triphosphate hydrolase protein [Camillea tinctor]|nr:P-loop containing nucleoside triphosphate hydrolase protein [Camillea tinctor]